MSEIEPGKEKGPEPSGDDAALPLTGEPAAPMRLRPEPPRVTRLSRRVLAGLGLVVSVGIGGALIYALQIQGGRKGNEELYATDNRATPDGLNSLPRDYTGPVLGPPLPGDLGRPILNAQNGVPPPAIATPNPGISAEEQRRLQELESARTARLFASTETRSAAPQPAATATTFTAPTPNRLPSAEDGLRIFSPEASPVSPGRGNALERFQAKWS